MSVDVRRQLSKQQLLKQHVFERSLSTCGVDIPRNCRSKRVCSSACHQRVKPTFLATVVQTTCFRAMVADVRSRVSFVGVIKSEVPVRSRLSFQRSLGKHVLERLWSTREQVSPKKTCLSTCDVDFPFNRRSKTCFQVIYIVA